MGADNRHEEKSWFAKGGFCGSEERGHRLPCVLSVNKGSDQTNSLFEKLLQRPSPAN